MGTRLTVIDPLALPYVLIELSRTTWQTLGTATATDPGVYLIRYTGAHPVYGALGRTNVPLYVGSAEHLSYRLTTHAASIDAAEDLDVAAVRVATLATLTLTDARVVERLLHEAFRPPWNNPALAGFGSRRQGQRREAAQLATPWDSLHPGRVWAAGMTPRDQLVLAKLATHAVISALAGP